MLRSPGRWLVLLALLTGLVALSNVAPLRAQKKEEVKPNPQAPVLKMPSPVGAQRGTTVDLVLTGTNLASPTGVWTSFPATVTIPTDGTNGKDAAKLLVKLAIPADTPVGFHRLGLATAKGMSSLRLFCVDDLPQVMQTAGNRSRDKAQAVTAPCAVVGRVDAEAADYYKVAGQAGQRLSFEVIGRRLGSAFDPQLTLFDAATGRELPGGFSNDAPGLQTDARLTHTFKEAGAVVVEVRDVSWRGGEDFVYRLRIGDFPCLTTPLPLAVQRGGKASVTFAGTQLDGVAPLPVEGPTDPLRKLLWLAPKGPSGLHAWPVTLDVSDTPEGLEQEPNDAPDKANKLPVPGAVSGRFEKAGDVDHFTFAAKKGERLILEAHALEQNSPTEVYLTLKDGKGGKLQETNPQNAPRLDFTPAADGEFTLAVEHLHRWGSPTETYRVSVTPYTPGFGLTVALDRYDVAAGGSFNVPVYVTRTDYPGPIELTVKGEGLSGKATVAAGQPANPVLPGATLTIAAAPDLSRGPRLFHIEGRATVNGKEVVERVSVRPQLTTAMGGLPVPPRDWVHDLALAVLEPPPLMLAAKVGDGAVAVGKTTPITVTAARAAGVTGEIALTVAGLPANVTTDLKTIPAGQNEAKGTITAAAAAAPATVNLTVTGKAKHDGKDVTANAPPVPLAVKK